MINLEDARSRNVLDQVRNAVEKEAKDNTNQMYIGRYECTYGAK